MQGKRLSGLFVNSIEAKDSIFESGKMAFQCLIDSKNYSLDYKEVDQSNRSLPANYDFYLFNYHITTMGWLDTKSLKTLLPGKVLTIVLEVSPNDPFVYCSPDDFDAYCVFDPTLISDRDNVFSFPRPLEVADNLPPYAPKDKPVIGSFGFATKGKGFEHLIDAVNKEFDDAIVKINIPYATYADETRHYAEYISQMCKSRAKNGIEVIVTHDYMTKTKLIEWCSENTINCFLYDRNMPGLAATTDQAISSGRPLIISKNDTFRHIEQFIKPYPQQTLKEAIENTEDIVRMIQNEWSPARFQEKFEQVLRNFQFDKNSQNLKSGKLIELPVKKEVRPSFIRNLRGKLQLRARFKNFIKG